MVRTPRAANRFAHWRFAFTNPGMFLWAWFVLLTPVHVVASGLPQPGDWLVVLMAPVVFFTWKGGLDRSSARMVRPLMWFTLWVTVVNFAWAIILGRFNDPKDFLIHPLFYAFNAAVFLCGLIIARRDREAFLRITIDVVYGTIFILTAWSFLSSKSEFRTQLAFNSPNQLGYYALLAACLFAMAQRPLGMSRVVGAIGITCCAYLAMLSASRASVAGILMLGVVLLFSNPRTIIVVSLVAVGLVSIGGPVAHAIEVSQKRYEHGKDARLSFSEERGYDRIYNNPEFLVTGAGEGGYERFVGEGQARREFHSSLGTIVFGYGIVGVILFTLFFFRVIQRSPTRMALMLVPPIVYTLAHQGLRFTMFWVVLAAFVVLKPMPDRTKKHAAKVPARP